MDHRHRVLLAEALRLGRSPSSTDSAVPIDYTQWSEEARSSPIAFLSAFYSDLPYVCRACSTRCVYSAEAQKYVMEVLKKRLEWHPTLCDACFAVRVGLERERDAFHRAWREKRGELARSANELSRWREVLQRLPQYGLREDSARIRQLEKLLGALPAPE